MLLCTLSVAAQPPQAFNYQGVARDGSGSPLAERNISLRLSILQGAFPGSVVYQETHYVLTNKSGVFSTEVGHGDEQFGVLEDVDWGVDNHYIQIEMDPDGGANFTLLGKAQLLSVPYALYAGKSTGGESLWQKNVSGIHYVDGYVGIGTDRPLQKLSIEGNDATGEDRFYLNLNNHSTSNRSLVSLNLAAGESSALTTLQHIAKSYDYEGYKFTDFGQLESSGRGLILRASNEDGIIKFLAGGNPLSPAERMRISNTGNVGIGTENPRNKLSILGNDPVGDARNYLDINNQSLSNRSIAWLQLSAGLPNSATTLQHCSETYDFDGAKYTDFGQVASSGRGLIVRAMGENGIIKFLLGQNEINSSVERMRLTTEGNLGLGTETPSSRLQVADGDVYIQDINNGVIMKSPDGSCWRMTINNDGSVKTTSISCPD